MAAGLPSHYLVVLRQLVYGWDGFYASNDTTWPPSSQIHQVVAGACHALFNKISSLWIRLSHWKVFAREREKTHLIVTSVCCEIWEIHPPNMIVYSQTLQALSSYSSLP